MPIPRVGPRRDQALWAALPPMVLGVQLPQGEARFVQPRCRLVTHTHTKLSFGQPLDLGHGQAPVLYTRQHGCGAHQLRPYDPSDAEYGYL